MTNRVSVEDLYVEDIVKELAKSLNVLYFEKNNTTTVNFPDNLGAGFIKATQFASGLGTIEASYFIKEDLVVDMDKSRVNPLKFVFNLGDTFYHKFDENEDFKSIKKYSGAIIGSSKDKSHTFKIPKNKEVYIFSLEINRNLFEHKIDDFNFDLGEDLDMLLRDVKAINPFFFQFLFNAEVFEAIQKITTNKREDFTGSLYKEGVTYTILSDTLETYTGNTDHKNVLTKITNKEIEQVLEISTFIDGKLEELPTIDIIARKFLVSESKMQKLFRNFYNCSVNDFIRNKRLNKGRELLEKTNDSITEISEKIGIKSTSYFSKVFKERYGVSPVDYRNSRLKNIRFY